MDRYFVGSQNRLQPRCIKPLPGCIVKELSYLTYLLHITFPNTQVFLNSFSSLEREKSKSLMTRRSSGFVEGVLQLPSTASTFGDLINRTSSIRQACVRVVHGSGGRSLPSSPRKQPLEARHALLKNLTGKATQGQTHGPCGFGQVKDHVSVLKKRLHQHLAPAR